METKLTMTKPDRERYRYAMEVIERRMSMRRASELMGVSVRQGARIVAEERLDGSRRLVHRGVELQATDITGPERPKRNAVRRVKEMPVPGRSGQGNPAADHPWRRGWRAERNGAAHVNPPRSDDNSKKLQHATLVP